MVMCQIIQRKVLSCSLDVTLGQNYDNDEETSIKENKNTHSVTSVTPNCPLFAKFYISVSISFNFISFDKIIKQKVSKRNHKNRKQASKQIWLFSILTFSLSFLLKKIYQYLFILQNKHNKNQQKLIKATTGILVQENISSLTGKILLIFIFMIHL